MEKAGIRQIDIESRTIFNKAEYELQVTGPVLEDEGLKVFL
jgi:hypothetical protein